VKQETMLLNCRVGSEGHNLYNEKCDIKQTSNDINVRNVTQEETAALKICNDVQQLPSSESFTQNVPSDMKEEEKSSSALGSLPRKHDEDVFLPISTSQVKHYFMLQHFYKHLLLPVFIFNYIISSLTNFCIYHYHTGTL
jgi:hypothetical protein